MSKLLCMRGISGSGKSTYVEQLKREGWAVVSRDNIREAVFKDYASVDETVVSVIEDASVHALLKAGCNVVVDNTNIRPKYLRHFAAIALEHNATFDVKQVDIDVNKAIGRVWTRHSMGGRLVPEEVIKKQHQDLVRNPLNEIDLYPEPDPTHAPYVAKPGTKKAILVDLDGTLARNNGHRSFYDFTKVYDDELIDHVAEVVRWADEAGYMIIIMSGRDDISSIDSQNWLNDNDVPWDKVYMRKTGDQRKDSIVKLELFNEYVRDNYDVQFVLDDRQQVVDAWRSIGLVCFQVAPGNF